MPSISAPVIAAGIGAGASIGSSFIGGNKAASAADKAAAQQRQMFDITQSNLAPYNLTGQSMLGPLATVAGGVPPGPDYIKMAYGLAPGPMTEADLIKTPGYQFTQSQGLKAVQSAAAARGIGVSGSALKGAASFVTGLADRTYQDQFNLQQKRFENALALNTAAQDAYSKQFQRMYYTSSLGENAAAGVGTAATATGQYAGQDITAAGQYQGAAFANAGNALNQGIQNYLGYKAYQDMMNPTNPNSPQGGSLNQAGNVAAPAYAGAPGGTSGMTPYPANQGGAYW